MAKRRKLPNGTGSIERVKKTVQGKTRLSQYRARLPAKYTKDGKKIQKDIGFFKTYNEALEALLNYKEPAPKVTFNDLFIQYKESKQFKGFSKNNKLRLERAFNRFEHLHDTNIKDIVYTDLQEVVDQMELEGYDLNGNHHDYSKSAIEKLKTVVNKIYNLANKNNIINYNLAPLLDIGGIKEKRNKEIFTKEEIEKMILSIPFNKNIRHILVMIFTGMRTGEYINLKKENFDFKNNTIINFGIKTEEGKKRKMFIHPKIETIAKELYLESKTGNIIEYEDKPLDYDTKFYKFIYYPALKKAGIKKKIPYTCRYTFATIAHNSGVDNKALQKLMGHTNYQITANSYIQDLDEYIYKELQKIN